MNIRALPQKKTLFGIVGTYMGVSVITQLIRAYVFVL